MNQLVTLFMLVTVSHAAQVPQVYAPNFGYATTALDVLNPAIPAAYSTAAYPSFTYAGPYGYAFNAFPYNYGLPYAAPSPYYNPYYHFATPAVQAASFSPAFTAPSAAIASPPAVIDTKATITAETEVDDAEIVEVDDTEVIIPDSSLPSATGPLNIRRIFPVFDDALKTAGNTVRFVSPTELNNPILPLGESPIVSVRKETEDIPTPSVIANNVLRTETVSPVAPAGIVQATQPQFVAAPFQNSVISPFLSSLIKASPIKF